MAYTELRDVAGGARLKFEPTRSGVISWNTHAPAGCLQFRLLRAHAPDTPWLTHVEWTEGGRLSHSPKHNGVSVDIDIVSTDIPFDGIDVHAESVRFDQLAFSSPVACRPSLPYARDAVILDVPARSQYVATNERGWCSPTALSMLHAYHGIDVSVEETAAQVFDRAYNGTGNWSFNVAFSGRLGLRASVAYLPNLDGALRLIEVDVDALGVDLLTIAGHKLYAPKGIGALYVRRGTALEPVLTGAGHERVVAAAADQ